MAHKCTPTFLSETAVPMGKNGLHSVLMMYSCKVPVQVRASVTGKREGMGTYTSENVPVFVVLYEAGDVVSTTRTCSTCIVLSKNTRTTISLLGVKIGVRCKWRQPRLQHH
jgi:hypothetical protein